MNYTIEEFRYLTVHDRCEPRYDWWSRMYECPWVLDRLPGAGTLHNTACGGEMEVHRVFARDLEACSMEVLHSDLTDQGIRGRFVVYDIRRPWEHAPFDAVLCVSTLEHLRRHDVSVALQHLLAQLVPGGVLLVTFDVPSPGVAEIERFAGRKLEGDPAAILTSDNCFRPDPRKQPLSIGVLMARRQPE
jgi:SAM-dependent methyltransferase